MIMQLHAAKLINPLQIHAAGPVRSQVNLIRETSGIMLVSELHILHQDPHRAGRAAKRSAARSDTDSVSDSSFLSFSELPLAVQSKIASHMTLADLRAFSEASIGMYRQESDTAHTSVSACFEL